jgi:branched-chain amino acid transport system ATP-binding protein
MNVLLELDAVDAGYGAAPVLRGVSLQVGAGERVALLGRNGAGKSTVLNTVLGIAARSAGRILLAGRVFEALPHHAAARAGIAVLRQERSLFPGLSVDDNLRLGLATGRAGRWTLARVRELFPVLRACGPRPAQSLSGGEQQMLCIARALLGNPRLVALDEPGEGLAPRVLDDLERALHVLADDGCGLLLVEQNLALVRRHAQRYLVLSRGEVVEQGDMSGLSENSLRRHLAV